MLNEHRRTALGSSARVVLYLGLTFCLSWGLELLEWSFEKSGRSYGLVFPPLAMLIPAFVAIGLRLFVFSDSPVHVKRYVERPRWIYISFLALVIVHGAVVLLAAAGIGPRHLLKILGSNLTILWALSVFYNYRRSTEASAKRAGLWIGDNDVSLKFLIAIVVYLLLQAALDAATGTGTLLPRADTVYGVPIPPQVYIPALAVCFCFFAVVAMPLGALAITFGEEYGWRGFLLDELCAIGKRKAALVIGLIWGLWHVPILLTGVHTYPPTAVGFVCSWVFFGLWGVIQTYVVLKSGSIWPAAFLHGLVNSVYGFIRTYIVSPQDKILSFGLGVYGIVTLAVVVAAVWRDPVWADGACTGSR